MSTVLLPDVKDPDQGLDEIVHLVCSCQLMLDGKTPRYDTIKSLCGMEDEPGQYKEVEADQLCSMCIEMVNRPCIACRCPRPHLL